jgi:hypothetical protein
MFGAPNDHVIRLTMPHIQRMFPEFNLRSIRAAHVWQARYAQPLVIRNYGRLIPPHRTPIAGVFIATMAQVYPEDRGTNYAIRDGRAVARLAADSILASDDPKRL